MRSYVFASTKFVEEKDFESLLSFADKCPEFFEVVLSKESELEVLFRLLGLEHVVQTELARSDDFEVLYDYSSQKLPEWTIEQFDDFYGKWLEQTGRESDMDEYGQLIFIQGHAANWNQNDAKFVLLAKS